MCGFGFWWVRIPICVVVGWFSVVVVVEMGYGCGEGRDKWVVVKRLWFSVAVVGWFNVVFGGC